MAVSNVKCSYRFLGCSGLKVSNLCLGTMTFGEHGGGRPGQCDEATAHAIMDRFAELGGNFIDTADAYQFGVSEQYIGNWLSTQQREKFVIATKVCSPMDPTFKDPNQLGLSRHHIMASIDKSLRRLQTDYVDLYQIHCWDDAVPLEETLSALNDLVRAGKVRYVGASNVTGWQLQKILDLSKTMGLDKWVTLQAQYSLLCRWTEWELVEICRREGLGLLPWSPLKGGWLAGKFTRDMTAPPPGTRVGWASEKEGRKMQSFPDFQQYASNEQFWALDDVLRRVAQEQGKTVSQVSLRWLLQKDTVSSVIIGVKTLQQLEDNMGAASGWELTQQQMADLDAASALEIPYPYEMVWRVNKAFNRQRP